MQYRTMPKSEDKFSILGYDCMRLPTRAGGETSRLIDKNRAAQQIKF